MMTLSHCSFAAFHLQVSVQLAPSSMSVAAAGDVLLSGQLAGAIKVEHSTWYCGESCQWYCCEDCDLVLRRVLCL
jgi:hypothetical protein